MAYVLLCIAGKGSLETIHRSKHRTRRRTIMDFAVILVIGNTLLALFIYIVVTKIWQD